jgi:hypothetical protein
MNQTNPKYDLAISFSGEERYIARVIADRISESGFRVFFDEYEEYELWGTDLTYELPERYRQSNRVLALFSESYVNKIWTTLERQTIILEMLKRRGTGYLLPLFLNDFRGPIPGLVGVTAYQTLSTTNPDDISRLCDLLERHMKSIR